jgi:hypothetical protein
MNNNLNHLKIEFYGKITNNPKKFCGKIESMTINYFHAKQLKEIDGNIKIEKLKLKNDELISEQLKFNNSTKKLIESKEIYHNSYTTIEKFIYEGILLKKIINPNYENAIIFEYNNKNQKIVKKYIQNYDYDDDVKPDWYNNYIYDSNNNLIKEERRSHHYALKDYFYIYDIYGNCIEKKGEYLLGPTVDFLKIISTYDNKNRLIKQFVNSYEESKPNIKHTKEYEYEENSNIIIKKKIIDHNSWRDETEIEYFKYDEQDNLKEYKEVRNDIILNEKNWEYIYDEEGNWIKSIEFKNNIATQITERKFEYIIEVDWSKIFEKIDED